jgi:hypothetical protein
MGDELNTSRLREAIAATIYQNCSGHSWNAASPTERALFLTGANLAIGLVLDAVERSLSEDNALPRRLN